jgi:hypothetical protein
MTFRKKGRQHLQCTWTEQTFLKTDLLVQSAERLYLKFSNGLRKTELGGVNDMARYIDANKIKLTGLTFSDINNEVYFSLTDVRKAIEQTPTADVVEVVRCKDCKHLNVLNLHHIYAICEKMNLLFEPFEIDTREHFCSYGERKEQG